MLRRRLVRPVQSSFRLKRRLVKQPPKRRIFYLRSISRRSPNRAGFIKHTSKRRHRLINRRVKTTIRSPPPPSRPPIPTIPPPPTLNFTAFYKPLVQLVASPGDLFDKQLRATVGGHCWQCQHKASGTHMCFLHRVQLQKKEK